MQRYELILEHPNFQRRKMISRTDPVISGFNVAQYATDVANELLWALEGLVEN